MNISRNILLFRIAIQWDDPSKTVGIKGGLWESCAELGIDLMTKKSYILWLPNTYRLVVSHSNIAQNSSWNYNLVTLSKHSSELLNIDTNHVHPVTSTSWQGFTCPIYVFIYFLFVCLFIKLISCPSRYSKSSLPVQPEKQGTLAEPRQKCSLFGPEVNLITTTLTEDFWRRLKIHHPNQLFRARLSLGAWEAL